MKTARIAAAASSARRAAPGPPAVAAPATKTRAASSETMRRYVTPREDWICAAPGAVTRTTASASPSESRSVAWPDTAPAAGGGKAGAGGPTWASTYATSTSGLPPVSRSKSRRNSVRMLRRTAMGRAAVATPRTSPFGPRSGVAPTSVVVTLPSTTNTSGRLPTTPCSTVGSLVRPDQASVRRGRAWTASAGCWANWPCSASREAKRRSRAAGSPASASRVSGRAATRSAPRWTSLTSSVLRASSRRSSPCTRASERRVHCVRSMRRWTWAPTSTSTSAAESRATGRGVRRHAAARMRAPASGSTTSCCPVAASATTRMAARSASRVTPTARPGSR